MQNFIQITSKNNTPGRFYQLQTKYTKQNILQKYMGNRYQLFYETSSQESSSEQQQLQFENHTMTEFERNVKKTVKKNLSQQQKIVRQKKMISQIPTEQEQFYRKISENSKSIPSLGKDIQIRNIKRHFMSICENATNINIKYSKLSPNIFIEYKQDGKTKILLLKYLIKKLNANKKRLKKNQIETLFEYYDFLYHKAPTDMSFLNKFILKRAKERNHFLLKQLIQANIKSEDIRLYYYFFENTNMFHICAIQRHFIDDITIDFQFLLKKKKALKVEFQLLIDYLEQLEQKAVQKIKGHQLRGRDEEEVESAQQDTYQSKKNHYEVEYPLVKLKQILNKDLASLEQKIQQRIEQFSQLNQIQGQKTQVLEKLEQQIHQMQINLTNFIATKDKVTKSLNNSKKANENKRNNIIKMNLKKMIIAEKQMQSCLPVLLRKRQIFQLLKKQNLIILEGETGSGKSTQLPQILCEYYDIFNPQKDIRPVLVTQPRKLATRSLAERVAMQMEEEVRGFVDYMSSAGKKINPNAKIVFKLDRLVLDELANDPSLSKYSCMILDQAHERTLSIDIILGMIKQLLTLRDDFKIIITSASMDLELFREYFQTNILKVSGRLYPVQIFHMEYQLQLNSTQKIKKCLLEQIFSVERTLKTKYRGHILIFCVSVSEINELCQYFETILSSKIFSILPLHGKLSPQQQKKVFDQSSLYKIIFASRIAETAITIQGVTVVIDPGQDIQSIYDQKNKVSSMRVHKISQSSAIQRAGRAGRTKQGFCFRLYSQKQFKQLKLNKTPEILNMSLDTLTLRLKSLQIKDILNFPFITQPSKEALKDSIEILKTIGCLSETEVITQIGKILVRIPIEPFLSRAVIEAMIFDHILKIDTNKTKDHFKLSGSLQKNIIEILSMLAYSDNLFFSQVEQRQKCDKVKFNQFSHKQGDFFFLSNIYKKFKQNYLGGQRGKLKQWAKNHYLRLKTLYQVKDLQIEIKSVLNNFQIRQMLINKQLIRIKQKINYCHSESDLIFSCLITSFCANLCLYSGHPMLGYTIISQKRTVQIYGTSTLSLQGITPKWIVGYNSIVNNQGRHYYKIAHSIDYQLLQKVVDPYVYETLKLKDAKTFIHFTNIFSGFCQIDYINSKQKQKYPILNKVNMFFLPDYNKIQIYFEKLQIQKSINKDIGSVELRMDQNLQIRLSPEDTRVKLNQYKNQIEEKFKQNYRYNFSENIIVEMSHGMNLEKIDTISTAIEYKMIIPSCLISLLTSIFSNYGKVQLSEQNHIVSLGLIVKDINNRTKVQEYLNSLSKCLTIQKFKYEQHLIMNTQKKPQAKVYMHFFAGISVRKQILINFYSQNEQTDYQTIQQHILKIKQALQVSTNLKAKALLQSYVFKPTKRGNAINCFLQKKLSRQVDAYDFYNILAEVHKKKIVKDFEMPSKIRQFLDPDIAHCYKTNKQWTEEIEKNILQPYDIHLDEETSVKVWGFNPNNRGGQKYLNQLQKLSRTILHAQIATMHITQLSQLKKQFNGAQSLLGSGKLHLQFQYEQVIAVVEQKVFNQLQQQYLQKSNEIKRKTADTFFDQLSKSDSTSHSQIFIRVRSSNKDNLRQPTQIIKKLFTPKQVKLDSHELHFLDKSEIGNDILNDIAELYRYRIYFGFKKMTSSLNLYCDDELEQQIIKILKKELKEHQQFAGQISYKGKNLNDIKNILEKQKIKIEQQQQGKFLHYEIIFQQRIIEVITEYHNFIKIQSAIELLIDNKKPECQICCDQMHRPYRLLNCSHEYCWQCIYNHVKENDNYFCPICKEKSGKNSTIKPEISNYDLKNLMQFGEFLRNCQIKISRNIERHPDFLMCYTSECYNILDKKKVQEDKSYQCNKCGIWYCYKCKESHKNSDCFEHQFKKLGIKKCPKCNYGVEKNKGCQHMKCINCSIHFCWKCLKYYNTEEQTYNHLAKECGGIFGNPGTY